MKVRIAAALLVSASIAMPAFGQATDVAATAPTPAVAHVAPAAPVQRELFLPSGTDLTVRVNDQLTTRTHRVGDNFSLTVVSDVTVDGHVVIPAGTRAGGQVTWRSGRGGFGKSGKMEIAVRYVEMDGRRIPLEGFHRQEGEGRTAATVGAIAGAGVIGGLFVRGSNARIPAGFELAARTTEAIPVTVGDAGGAAVIAASYTPGPVATEVGRRRDQRPPREERRQRRAAT